jgi:zinc protease
MDDIHAITTEHARAFYRTYYAPNNATVILVGDVDEGRALELIEKRYGAIPSQPIPTDAIAPEPAQTSERRLSFEKPVLNERLMMGYKSPALTDADYPVAEVMCEILVGGNSSRLYRALVVDSEIASSVNASAAPFRDPGLLEVGVSLQSEHEAAKAEAIIDAELERIKSNADARALEIAKTRLETRLWSDLRPNSGKAEALGHFQVTGGDYQRLFRVADAYRRITVDDVARVARKVFDRNCRTVVVATPAP